MTTVLKQMPADLLQVHVMVSRDWAAVKLGQLAEV
jgi:hypothetical protein